MNRSRNLRTALLALIVSAAPLVAHATDISWNVAGPADWSVAGNWDTATVPGATDHAFVSNGGTANITSDVGTVLNATIQDSTVNQTGGKLVVPGAVYTGAGDLEGSFFLDPDTGTKGTFNLSAGTLETGAAGISHGGVGGGNNFTGWAYIGGAGDGDPGTVGNAEFNLSGTGNAYFHQRLHIGLRGNGVLNQTGGTLTADGDNQYDEALIIGDKTGSSGTYNLSGGTATVNNTMTVGNWQGTGYLNVSGTGNLSVTSGNLNIGGEADTSPTGIVTQSGAGSKVTITNDMVMSVSATSTGNYTLSGGSLSVGGVAKVGDSGTATLTQTGGNSTLNTVIVGGNAGSNGTVNLKGGSMTIPGFLSSGSGSSLFSFTGGTLKVGNIDNSINASGLGPGGNITQQNTDAPSLLDITSSDTTTTALNQYSVAGGTISVDNGHSFAASGTSLSLGGSAGGATATIKIAGAASNVNVKQIFMQGTNAADKAQIAINGGTFRTGSIFQGNSSSPVGSEASIVQTAGTLVLNGTLFVGNPPSDMATSTFTLSGGTVTSDATLGGFPADSILIGNHTKGSMTISGAADVKALIVELGKSADPNDHADGLLTQTGGTMELIQHLVVGNKGATPIGSFGLGGTTGVMEQSGGVNTIGLVDNTVGGASEVGNLIVGSGRFTGGNPTNTNGIGIYRMHGGTNIIGSVATSHTQQLSVGMPTVPTLANVRNFDSSANRFPNTTFLNVQDGNLILAGYLGYLADATFIQDNAGGGDGGLNKINGNIIVGNLGPAVMTQSAGTNIVGILGTSRHGGDVVLGLFPGVAQAGDPSTPSTYSPASSGSAGTYNLKGGLLDVSQGKIFRGLGSGTFNFTGGTLMAQEFDSPVYASQGAGNLGGLTQNNTDGASLLDASGNNTKIFNAYNLKGGTATVGAGKTIDNTGPVTASTGANKHIGGAGTFNATNGFNVAAGSTLNYDGSGASGILNIDGAQAHGAGSILKLNGGETNINSDPSGNLEIDVDPSKVHFNNAGGSGRSKVAALNVLTGSTADLKQNGAPTYAQTGSPYGYIGSNKYLITTTVSTAGTGKLDLTNNTMVVNYGAGANPLAAITAAIKTGAAVSGGVPAWNGPGINSSSAAADYVTNPGNGLTALGVLDNGDAAVNPGYDHVNNGVFNIGGAGDALPANSVLVKYTYLGDTQLAGKVQFSDFLVWKAAFAANLSGGHVGGWAHAQFDYSASQTVFADFLVWKNSFSKTLAGLLPNLHANSVGGLGAATAVPEPSSLMLLAIGAGMTLLLKARRRPRT